MWKAEPNRFVAEELAGLKPSGQVVDLAAGEGRNAVWLAEHGGEVDAVDFPAVALEKAGRPSTAVCGWALFTPISLSGRPRRRRTTWR
ncbi:SAM-dependent methyltransferase [Streptomyces sp. NPDC102394]|uniref:SAM-dependent methyltransferase n=1 Tax=Streptomyces sp. NPDC102394 TaxID=3366167 RepID=UPI0037FAA1EF